MLVGCTPNASAPLVVVVTATPQPTPTPCSKPTQTPCWEAGLIPDLERGQQVWIDKQCRSCHGPEALGGIGPALAAVDESFPVFLKQVRTSRPPMPGFNRAEVTDRDAYNVYAWLRTLVALSSTTTAPTPTVRPTECVEMQGMTIWTTFHCDDCHGAFAQGSAKAPPLAQPVFSAQQELVLMRSTGDKVPEHRADKLDDITFLRLYKWLQTGAGLGPGECTAQ